MFIELTLTAGKKRTFNIDNISDFGSHPDEEVNTCQLILVGGEKLYVDEAYETVKELIENKTKRTLVLPNEGMLI